MRSFLSASSVVLFCLASLGSAAKLVPRYRVCEADEACPNGRASKLDFGVLDGIDMVTCYYYDNSKCVYDIKYLGDNTGYHKYDLNGAKNYSEGPSCTDHVILDLVCKIAEPDY
ncbi:hypothetical protein FRB99_003358 [Tulasnella sp. 403]|nr:hypothetical protein FRB99_003358 [Tulasnella sp. 403]